MRETGSNNIVTLLRRKWIFKALLSKFFLVLGFAVLTYTILYKLFSLSLFGFLPYAVVLFIVLVIIDRRTRISDYDVTRFLNISNPSLEESAGLLLKQDASLNILEKLQIEKVKHELHVIEKPDPFKKRFVVSLLVLLMASLISFAVFKIPFSPLQRNATNVEKASLTVNRIPEKLLPEIKRAAITINPPSYTGKGSRQQNRFNLLAEEGATITWQIQTNIQANEVSLVFNDGGRLMLSKDAEQLNWRTQKQISRAGFYQVKIDSNLSELYKIETIKDQRPTITIQTPQPNTYINYGQTEIITVKGILADDYGIRSAGISATISSGQGEGVKFKEQKLSLAGFKPGQRLLNVGQSINCKALGMQPGDELYFFINAIDNHNQETRSQVYIITLQDTANLTSMNGMVSPLDIQPELFRSQRQIIIETERLLKNKSKISVEEFRKKSNDLGIDQKLLRMRYGKFLGEETDVDIGGDHAHEEEEHTEEPQDIIDQYSHKHDNAEDASFFDAATKKQLKATLAEMWKSEIKLRTILPKEALPFEYKALQLLKDLQQKSRVYVGKTGIKTTPLKLDKRLTGDLDKIGQPVTQESIQKNEPPAITIRRALGILDDLKVHGRIDASSKEILQKAFYQLSIVAADQPSVYIPSLSALKKVISESYRLKDIVNAQFGLQKMAAVAEKLPSSGLRPAMGLSTPYFNNLKGKRQ